MRCVCLRTAGKQHSGNAAAAGSGAASRSGLRVHSARTSKAVSAVHAVTERASVLGVAPGATAGPQTAKKGKPGRANKLTALSVGAGKATGLSNPASSSTPRRVPAAEPPIPGLLQTAACNTCVEVVRDGPLRPFVGGTFRATASFSRQVDMLSLAALAAMQWLWQRPTTRAAVMLRCVAYACTLLFTAWVIGTRNPFWPHDGWKLWVKVGSLILAALAAVLTHFAVGMTFSYGSPPNASLPGYAADEALRVALSYAVFAGCVLLGAVLAAGFCWSSIRGAARESAQDREAAAARLNFLQVAATATGVALNPEQEARLRRDAELVPLVETELAAPDAVLNPMLARETPKHNPPSSPARLAAAGIARKAVAPAAAAEPTPRRSAVFIAADEREPGSDGAGMLGPPASAVRIQLQRLRNGEHGAQHGPRYGAAAEAVLGSEEAVTQEKALQSLLPTRIAGGGSARRPVALRVANGAGVAPAVRHGVSGSAAAAAAAAGKRFTGAHASRATVPQGVAHK